MIATQLAVTSCGYAEGWRLACSVRAVVSFSTWGAEPRRWRPTSSTSDTALWAWTPPRPWIEEARAGTTGLPGAVTCVADAENLPFPDRRFDALACLGVVDRLPDPAAALAEACRVVRPDGVIVVSFLNRLSPYYAWRLGVFYPAVRATKRLVAAISRQPVSPHLAQAAWRVSSSEVEHMLQAHGVAVDEVVFYHFNLLPSPVDEWLRRPALRLAQRGDRLAGTRWRCLGGAFLVRAHRVG